MASAVFSQRSAGRVSATVVDGVLAIVVCAATVALLAHGGVSPVDRPPVALDVRAVVVSACVAAPLLVWRRFPQFVFAVSTAACAVLLGLGYPMDLTFGPAVALYLLAAARDRPWTFSGAGVVGAALAGYLVTAGIARARFPGLELLHSGLAWAVAWFAGERTRLRRDQIVELRERVTRAERDAERERLLAVAEERARIARDLHDSAGHAISVIAVRAGAARLRHHEDPDRSLAALHTVEELARTTIADIDQLVGALREGSGTGPDSPPGLASLETLAAHHIAAGLPVSVRVTGQECPLAAAADQAAYRIVQEGLRNAARHGAGAATVTVAYEDDAVSITITNPYRPATSRRRGGGHGLIGMRERAAVLGGALDIADDHGVFRVHATVPARRPAP